MIDTSNYWVGDYILGPILIIVMLGTAFWYAFRRDELEANIEAMHTCDDTCHGNDDMYIYKDYTALMGVHALEQRVAKIENTNDVYWSEKIKDLIDTFSDTSSIPMKYAWNTNQEYYIRLKTFEKFNNCTKCKEENENFMKENMEYIGKHSLYIKQECKCKEQSEQP